MDQEAAETLALQGLAWLASDPDRISRMLAETGLELDELRAGARDARLLAGILDYLLADEQRLLAFCGEADLAPALPAKARARLPGASPW